MQLYPRSIFHMKIKTKRTTFHCGIPLTSQKHYSTAVCSCILILSVEVQDTQPNSTKPQTTLTNLSQAEDPTKSQKRKHSNHSYLWLPVVMSHILPVYHPKTRIVHHPTQPSKKRQKKERKVLAMLVPIHLLRDPRWESHPELPIWPSELDWTPLRPGLYPILDWRNPILASCVAPNSKGPTVEIRLPNWWHPSCFPSWRWTPPALRWWRCLWRRGDKGGRLDRCPPASWLWQSAWASADEVAWYWSEEW